MRRESYLQFRIRADASGRVGEKQNGPQAWSLWAARWTVWDWPRGGHSTWPLRQLRAPDRPASGGINPYSPVVCGL